MVAVSLTQAWAARVRRDGPETGFHFYLFRVRWVAGHGWDLEISKNAGEQAEEEASSKNPSSHQAEVSSSILRPEEGLTQGLRD